MGRVLVIEDEKIIQKFLNEFSEEISIVEIGNSTKVRDKVLNYNNITLNSDSYEVYNGDTKIELTNKEFEILKLLLENPNKVFSRNSLLNNVWNYDYLGDEKIVNTHIKNIRKKLGCDIIKTVRGAGYKIL